MTNVINAILDLMDIKAIILNYFLAFIEIVISRLKGYRISINEALDISAFNVDFEQNAIYAIIHRIQWERFWTMNYLHNYFWFIEECNIKTSILDVERLAPHYSSYTCKVLQAIDRITDKVIGA